MKGCYKTKDILKRGTILCMAAMLSFGTVACGSNSSNTEAGKSTESTSGSSTDNSTSKKSETSSNDKTGSSSSSGTTSGTTSESKVD